MKFPTLYKKAATGKIYVWNIRVDGAKITTRDGYEGGKMKENYKILKAGKGGRTPEEQAESEAQSKWNAKVNRQGYSQTKKAANKLQVRPMLAQKFEPKKLKKGRQYAIQRKYDGIRTMVGTDGRLMSRKGVEFTAPVEIAEEAVKVLQHADVPDTFYLDGEIYSETLPFEVVSGLVRQETVSPEDRELMKQLKYVVYDAVDTDDLKMTFGTRSNIVRGIMGGDLKYIYPAETFPIEDVDDVRKMHDKFVANGYEGAMIRDIDSPYEMDKRSKYLMKFKDFKEEEFKITGFKEGTGSDRGTVVWIAETPDGKEFSVRPEGTREYRRELFDNAEKYIGKMLTVKFFEYTKDGVPRFPVGKDIREGY